MKSIKQKILAGFLTLVAAAALVCGGVGIATNYSSARSMLKQNVTTMAAVAAERVAYELTAYRNAIAGLGMVPELSSSEVSIAEKEQIVDQWASYYGMERGNLLNTAGVSLFDGNSYADREYFQQAVQGNAFISTPTVSKITGELSIMVAAPLWLDGREGGTVAGVVYFVPQETFLNDIMKSIHVSENGGAYMIGRDGTTIADTTLETVAVQNVEAEAQSDPSLSDLAALHADMRAGRSGFGSYTMGGVSKSMGYAPVSGTDGWSIAITAPDSDFLGATYRSLVIIVILVAVILAAAFLCALKMANSLGRPIRACAERLQQLGEGDLSAEVPSYQRKDEIGVLSTATNQIVSRLQSLIGDLEYLLGEMAQGNFNVRSRDYSVYQNDYAPVLAALRNINYNLSSTLQQINLAAEQVSAGAEQVSSGAQALAVSQGLPADVVTLALEADVQVLADEGLIDEGWIDEFPNHSAPYTSTIVFLVRQGNPKAIRDWDDLVREDVGVITPNPKTSGGARWNFLAAWAYADALYDGDEAQITDFITRLYQNVLVLDSGARGATTTFVENGQGDVLVAWENEAYLSMRDDPDEYEIVNPSISILAQPSVAVVDDVVEYRGTRDVATEYLQYLYSDDAQRIAGDNYYRPTNPEILKEYADVFDLDIDLVSIQDFGGWDAAQEKHFSDGGIFDQIYEK